VAIHLLELIASISPMIEDNLT